MADISSMTLPNGTTYNIKDKVARASIPYGIVDSTSTAAVFTATVEGITELYNGVTVMLHNGVVTSAAGFTVDINGLGAKKCYSNLTNATQETTIFNVNYTMLFVYSEALDNGDGGWWIYRGYDSNTNTIGYQLRTNSGNLVASDGSGRYRLWFTSADAKKWVPANTSTTSDATTARTFNTRAINPFGPIVYNSTNGTVASGARPTVTALWQQYTLTIGYSYVKSMTAWIPVFLKCTPKTDGSATMADIVQALPTSKDGFIYIFLGIAYSATAMELRAEHPVYWHDGTGIRLWTGAESETITVDSALSATSENPVQNKVVNSAISAKYTKPSGGIPASDLASGVIPTVPSAYTSNPAMNGTASAGSSTAWARGDHVHPTDTSRQATLVSGTNIKTVNSTSLLGSGNIAVQATLVSGTNIKTVNGESLLGSGDLTVSGLPSVTTTDNGKVLKVVNGEWEPSTGGSGLTDPGTLPSLTTTVSSETLTITWSAGTLPS